MNKKLAYSQQKWMATKRGIAWKLTFEQWYDIWEKSGRWNERGRKFGQYVMARYGDVGPYSVNNIHIITNVENNKERKFTPEVLKRMSDLKLGNTLNVGDKNGQATITNALAKKIKTEFQKNPKRGRIAELSRRYKVKYGIVYVIATGRGWKHV